jgi:S-adenosylmethionine synthetase
MARSSFIFTSESVSEGHPDKVADQISDAVVDLFLSKDPQARVACETLTTTQRVILAGEVRGLGMIDRHGNWEPGAQEEIQRVVRDTVKRIGYEQDGFHWQNLHFENHLHPQSAHIAQGVDASGNKDEGAGDQGIMFGYATDETPDLMPATLYYSHRILQRMAADRHAGTAPFLEPDAKSQVTLEYRDEVPVRAVALVVSTQHALDFCVPWETRNEDGTIERGGDAAKYKVLHDYVMSVFHDVLPDGFVTPETVVHINPTGRFEIGGPDGDAGVTGRKIIVDTYGGASPHGGGAFSGKDPTKVDRSAAYVTRFLAKNIVAAGLATRCTIQLSYAIGVAEPLSIHVDLHGTGRVSEDRIEALLGDREQLGFALTPRGIREKLGLNRPIYQRSAAYGHFGRTPDAEGGFSWEKLDLVETLRGLI